MIIHQRDINGDEPKLNKNKLLKQQHYLFLLVGFSNTLAGFIIFSLVQFLAGTWVTYLGSLIISHFLVSGCSFYFYRRFVFNPGRTWYIDFVRFQMVYIVPFGINLIILPILVSGFKVNVYLSQGFILIMNAGISYLGHKFFSFRKNEQKN